MRRDCVLWAALVCLPVGAALVLLALLGVTDGRTSASSADAALRWRVEMSLASQEGCLTCHVRSMSGAPAAAMEPAPMPIEHAPIRLPVFDAPPSSDWTAIETRLRDVGERLLELPRSEHADFQMVAEQYLAVVQTVRADGTLDARQALRDLVTVEGRVRALENRAHPVQARSRTTSRDDARQGVAPGTSGPLTVAASPSLRLLQAFASAAQPLALLELLTLPALAVVLVKRRGPPVRTAPTEAGWIGRSPLNCCSGDLPFFLVTCPPLQSALAARGCSRPYLSMG